MNRKVALVFVSLFFVGLISSCAGSKPTANKSNSNKKCDAYR